eukprot:160654-Chlamydomonas_euryale.AAC.7
MPHSGRCLGRSPTSDLAPEAMAPTEHHGPDFLMTRWTDCVLAPPCIMQRFESLAEQVPIPHLGPVPSDAGFVLPQ